MNYQINNGICSDGGPGVSFFCNFGTDCDDCGPRFVAPPPPLPTVAGPPSVAAPPSTLGANQAGLCVVTQLMLQHNMAIQNYQSAPASVVQASDAVCAAAASANAFGVLNAYCTTAAFANLTGAVAVASTCSEYEVALGALCSGIGQCFSLSLATLVYVFFAAVDIVSFDVAAFQTAFAAAAGVPASTVSVTVESASVAVTATVVLPDQATATALKGQLAGQLSEPSAASSALGVTITTVQEPTVQAYSGGGGPSGANGAPQLSIDDYIIYMAAGGGALLLVIVVAIVWCRRANRGLGTTQLLPATPKAGSSQGGMQMARVKATADI